MMKIIMIWLYDKKNITKTTEEYEPFINIIYLRYHFVLVILYYNLGIYIFLTLLVHAALHKTFSPHVASKAKRGQSAMAHYSNYNKLLPIIH